MVPRVVNRCQGNCANEPEIPEIPVDKDYIAVKSRGCTSFMNKQGEKYCPLYIRFKAECLKEYAWRIHDVHYEAFPFSQIMLEKAQKFCEGLVKVFLNETGMDVSNTQE